MYKGPHDVRVTARCPSCRKVTQKELDYRYANLVGAKYQYEIISAFNCDFCKKRAFEESRIDVLAFSAVEERESGRVS